jgi:lipopolysaccharide export system protein LptC
VNDKLAAWFPLLLLALLAAMTFWINRIVQPQTYAGNGSGRHDPDFIVDNVSAMTMGPDGNIKHTLAAVRMIHYPDDDTTHLQMPKFVSLTSPKAPMTITSREALVSKEGENVFFNDNVRVTRSAYADKSELVMVTSYLHVIPDKDIAKTDRPVTITDANTIVNSIGLELNNKTRILKLESQVRGRYEISKK